MFKKALVALLSLTVLLSFAACGKSSAPANAKTAIEKIYADSQVMGMTLLDETQMSEMLGLTPDLYEEAYAKMGFGRFDIADAIIIKPSKGNEDAVKQLLEQHKQNRMDTFQNYNVGGDYDKAKNAEIFTQNDYVILLLAEDNAPARAIVDEYIPK